MKTNTYRITWEDAYDLYHYLTEIKRCVKSAIIARTFNDDGHHFWIRRAKEFAADARRWSKKLGIHFGLRKPTFAQTMALAAAA